ncbi:transposase [Streptomyces sp. NPDC002730]|uniref:transposase n=1 Tax=Streptomyces sp. NPDC002730 TaxID=3364662 RepID=UPI0036A7F1CC
MWSTSRRFLEELTPAAARRAPTRTWTRGRGSAGAWDVRVDPIVLVRDNLNTHQASGIREFIAGREWLTVYQLPSYAPGLNPLEVIRSPLRRVRLTNHDALIRHSVSSGRPTPMDARHPARPGPAGRQCPPAQPAVCALP